MLVASIATSYTFDFYLRFDMVLKLKKVRNHDSRTALRLPRQQRQQIDKLVESGKFKNLSHVIRAALDEFLEN